MIDLEQKIVMKWTPKNKEHYVKKGYTFTKYHDIFEINVLELPLKSVKNVKVTCDYCNKLYYPPFFSYFRAINHEYVKKACCTDCKSLKINEIVQVKYGVPNISHLESVKQKREKTCLERYGVTHTSKTKEVKDKIRSTNLNRYGVKNNLQIPSVVEKVKTNNLNKYGVENAFSSQDVHEKMKQDKIDKYGFPYNSQIEEIKNKMIETNQKKYGVDFPLQSAEIRKKCSETLEENYGVSVPVKNEDIKNKMFETNIQKYGTPCSLGSIVVQEKKIKTNLEKYGVEHYAQTSVMHEKAKKTMFENQTVATSVQQCYLQDILGGILNFPVGTSNLDIAFVEKKIYIEYDGSGHDLSVKLGHISLEAFKTKEKKRYYALRDLGWKLIKIKSKKDLLPQSSYVKNLFIDCVKYLENGHRWIEIDFDESTIRSSQFIKPITNIHLNKVKKNG